MLREHGALEEVVGHLREKQAHREEANARAAAAAAEESSGDEGEDEEGGAEEKEEEEADEVMRDPTEKGSDEEMDGAEEVRKPKTSLKKEKGKAVGKTKGAKAKGGKVKGGVVVPESWPWERAKELFLKPDVTPADDIDLEWKAPDIEGLVEFLVRDKGFKWVYCLSLSLSLPPFFERSSYSCTWGSHPPADTAVLIVL